MRVVVAIVVVVGMVVVVKDVVGVVAVVVVVVVVVTVGVSQSTVPPFIDLVRESASCVIYLVTFVVCVHPFWREFADARLCVCVRVCVPVLKGFAHS